VHTNMRTRPWIEAVQKTVSGLTKLHPVGKLVDNACIESFKSRVRDECLAQQWVLTLDDARRILREWRVSYTAT